MPFARCGRPLDPCRRCQEFVRVLQRGGETDEDRNFYFSSVPTTRFDYSSVLPPLFYLYNILNYFEGKKPSPIALCFTQSTNRLPPPNRRTTLGTVASNFSILTGRLGGVRDCKRLPSCDQITDTAQAVRRTTRCRRSGGGVRVSKGNSAFSTQAFKLANRRGLPADRCHI